MFRNTIAYFNDLRIPDFSEPIAFDFTSPNGDFSTLVRNADMTFTRTLRTGAVIDFDAAGLMTAVTDRNGNATNYGYDAGGRLTSVTDPAGLVTTLAYDGAGKLSSVTDPALRVTSFTVDANGDLVTITDPDLSARHFAYDARHRLATQTSKRGFIGSYHYGFDGRFRSADRPDLTSVSVDPALAVGLIDPSLDAGTRGTAANPAPLAKPEDFMAVVTDARGNASTRVPDRYGQAKDVTDALLRTRTSIIDENGLTTERTLPNGRVDQFTYDGAGNLLTRTEAVGTPLERTSSFAYEPVLSFWGHEP